MGSATFSGEDRARKAAEGAINSPLLNNNDIRGAKNILVNITSGETKEVTMDEVNLVNEYVQEMAGNNADLIHGIAVDPSLGDALTVTVVATGFKSSSIPELRTGVVEDKVRVSIEDNYQDAGHHGSKSETFFSGEASNGHEWMDDPQEEVIERLYPKRMIDPFSGAPEVVRKVMHVDFYNQTEEYINELSKIPAFERRRMKQQKPGGNIDNGKSMSRYSISANPEEGLKLSKNNSFLHDKAD